MLLNFSILVELPSTSITSLLTIVVVASRRSLGFPEGVRVWMDLGKIVRETGAHQGQDCNRKVRKDRAENKSKKEISWLRNTTRDPTEQFLTQKGKMNDARYDGQRRSLGRRLAVERAAAEEKRI